MTARGLDAEIARINKMRISACERSAWVKRAKTVAGCIAEGPAPEQATMSVRWCGRCGFLISLHDRLRRVISP